MSIREVILIIGIVFAIWVTYDDYDKPEWVIEVEAASEAEPSILGQPISESDVLVAPVAE